MTKILLLAANPKDTNELQLYQEIYEIEQEVRRARFGTQFNFVARPEVRLRDLSQLLAEVRPDIVHFSGHGSRSSEIILVDEDGNSRPVESEALKTIFAHLKGNIRCVVLNACYIEPQADAMAREIDCVVGMLGAIGDKAAINFAREFYRQLANGKDVGTAFELGRAQIPNGQTLARLHSINANPSHVVFIKEGWWLKYTAIITIVLIIAFIMSLGWYFGLFKPSVTPTTSIPLIEPTPTLTTVPAAYAPDSSTLISVTSISGQVQVSIPVTLTDAVTFTPSPTSTQLPPSPTETETPSPFPTSTSTSMPPSSPTPLPTAFIKAHDNLEGGVRHIVLTDGELVVGTADRFQDSVSAAGQPPCTAFLIRGPVEMELKIWYGGWDQWANVYSEEFAEVLLEQKLSELQRHQTCPARGIETVRLP